MTRRLSAAALGAVLLVALAACSKTETTSTTPATNAPTTAAPTTEKSTETTKKSSDDDEDTTDTTRRSTASTKASSGGDDDMPTKDIDLTAEEEACANLVYGQYLSENPDATDANKAGALGASIVGCTEKAKVADTILNGLSNSDFGKNLTENDKDCMRDKIISLDTEELGTVLGVFIYAGTTLDLGPAVQALTSLAEACNVSLN